MLLKEEKHAITFIKLNVTNLQILNKHDTNGNDTNISFKISPQRAQCNEFKQCVIRIAPIKDLDVRFRIYDIRTY